MPLRDNRALLRELARTGRIQLEGVESLLQQPDLPLQTPPDIRWPRLEAMLLALAIGDALGNTSEAQNPATRHARNGYIRDYLPNRYAAGRPLGLPSDDSQLAFWTLESMLAHDGLDPARLAERFCEERVFGIGSAVRAFVDAYTNDGRPWEEAGQPSAGNGALMRIAPVIVPHLAHGGSVTSTISADAALAAMVTHNDPTSTSACVAFAWMLARLMDMTRAPEPAWWLDAYIEVSAPLEGETRLASRVPGDTWTGPLWRFVDTRVRSALEAGLSAREACDGWYSGAFLLETVPSALYILARHAGEPEVAMLSAVNDTRDNDTVAAIVGAALGALHGSAWIPAHWRSGLLGRTGASDDGRTFALVDAARERWASSDM